MYFNNLRFESDVLKNSSLWWGGSLWQQKILVILKTFLWLHVGRNLRSANLFCSTITITLLNLVCLPQKHTNFYRNNYLLFYRDPHSFTSSYYLGIKCPRLNGDCNAFMFKVIIYHHMQLYRFFM
jgi:hypothetical protein